MAKTIMIQGTMSNAGKSILTAGLIRIFKQDGYSVAPFKSQNMALNSYITKDGGEIGRAQAMQAEAAGIEADVNMNPILLKPTGGSGSQVIVRGKVAGQLTSSDYYKRKYDFVPQVKEAFDELSNEYDIIVIEGAGSPAEINIKDHDIANMGIAKIAKAPVLLVGDIERGGVFASLAGTLLLFDEEEKSHVKGMIINKFHGDIEILRQGLEMIEEITGKPVLGVVPYTRLDIDDEDSLSERLNVKSGRDLIDITILRLPHISNFTDFNVLSLIPGIGVRYVSDAQQLGNPDMIIIPGTKNTMSDLKWVKDTGLDSCVRDFALKDGIVFGVCGGYQMLGKTISDPSGVEEGGTMDGLGLLPIETVFAEEKTLTRSEGTIQNIGGALSPMSGAFVSGYEIHMGVSEVYGAAPLLELTQEASSPKMDGCCSGNIYGTYLHGIFDTPNAGKALAEALYKRRGLDTSNIKSYDLDSYKQSQYDKLAEILRVSLDIDKIYEILDKGV